MRILAWLVRVAQPPHGMDVRKLLVLFSASVALPRIGVQIDGLLRQGIPFVLIDVQVYGVAFALLAIGLGVTCCGGLRLSLGGRIVAGVGAVLWTVLAADVIGVSTTSFLINLGLAWACLGEAASIDDR